MKEIKIEKEVLLGEWDTLAIIRRQQYEYGDSEISLHRCAAAIVYCEELAGDRPLFYALNKDEREEALKAPRLWLENILNLFDFSDEDSRLEMCRWGVSDCDDYAAKDGLGDEDTNDGDGWVIVREGIWFNQAPLDLMDEEGGKYGEAKIYSTLGEAREQVEEWDSGTYITMSGEAGRPNYYIWPA